MRLVSRACSGVHVLPGSHWTFILVIAELEMSMQSKTFRTLLDGVVMRHAWAEMEVALVVVVVVSDLVSDWPK